jgi:hypothetical protein
MKNAPHWCDSLPSFRPLSAKARALVVPSEPARPRSARKPFPSFRPDVPHSSPVATGSPASDAHSLHEPA